MAFSSGIRYKTQQMVYVVNIQQEITKATWRQVQAGIPEAADSLKSGCQSIIHMNTYGGAVVDADSIRTLNLNKQDSGICFY